MATNLRRYFVNIVTYLQLIVITQNKVLKKQLAAKQVPSCDEPVKKVQEKPTDAVESKRRGRPSKSNECAIKVF
jgi:hypothetical protein